MSATPMSATESSAIYTAQTRVEGSLRTWIQRLPMVLRPGPALGYDLMRAYLGIGLFVRGVLFVSEPELLLGYLQNLNSWFLPYALVHFVAVAHLCGGVMLATGLLTRLAAAIQLPVLFGAVFLHSSGGLLNPGQSLEFSGLVLALLLVYFVFGSGELSVDRVLRESHSRSISEPVTPSLIPELPLRSSHPALLARAAATPKS